MIVFFINISHFQLAGSPVRSGPWYQIKSMKRKVINWEKFLDNFFDFFMGLSLSNIHSIFTLDFRKIELMRWFDFTICVYIFLLLSFLLSQIVGLLMKNIFCWCLRFCFEIKINWYKFLQSCTNSNDITTLCDAINTASDPPVMMYKPSLLWEMDTWHCERFPFIPLSLSSTHQNDISPW